MDLSNGLRIVGFMWKEKYAEEKNLIEFI